MRAGMVDRMSMHHMAVAFWRTYASPARTPTGSPG